MRIFENILAIINVNLYLPVRADKFYYFISFTLDNNYLYCRLYRRVAHYLYNIIFISDRMKGHCLII